jgi:hypothetical protein
MIFLDSDILSYYFSGNIKIRDKMVETNKLSPGLASDLSKCFNFGADLFDAA